MSRMILSGIHRVVVINEDLYIKETLEQICEVDTSGDTYKNNKMDVFCFLASIISIVENFSEGDTLTIEARAP